MTEVLSEIQKDCAAEIPLNDVFHRRGIPEIGFDPIRRVLRDRIKIHFHCGKTGGSTMGSIIANCIEHRSHFSSHVEAHNGFGIWPIELIRDKWELLGDDVKREIRWTGGHVPFGVHEVFKWRCVYFGMVREPNQLWLSSLAYKSFTDPNWSYSGKSLDEIVDLTMNTVNANPQTRHFSGAFPGEIISQKHLESAKRNIRNHFLFVGITETFNAAVAVCILLFEWNASRAYYLRKNETPFHSLRSGISEIQHARIRCLHALNWELYNFCLSRFDALVEFLGSDYKEVLKGFECILAKC